MTGGMRSRDRNLQVTTWLLRNECAWVTDLPFMVTPVTELSQELSHAILLYIAAVTPCSSHGLYYITWSSSLSLFLANVESSIDDC